MSCSAWNERWVARHYGELDPEDERLLEEHLAGCESCRSTLEDLGRARSLLREGMPSIPAAPRTVVLRTSRWSQPVWAFAGGLAAALVVFALGAWAGLTVLGGSERAVVSEPGTRAGGEAASPAAIERRIVSLEAELARLSARPEPEPAVPAGSCVTPEQLEAGLSRLEQQVRYDRFGDVEYLLGEMQAVERRAAGWVDETREAVRLVALSSDPRLSER
jgi:hypothetical protein